MKTLISEAEKIMKKLEKEGKVEILDSEEYMKIFDEIDKEMEDVHRDYIIKSHQSWIEAGKVILYQNSN